MRKWNWQRCVRQQHPVNFQRSPISSRNWSKHRKQTLLVYIRRFDTQKQSPLSSSSKSWTFQKTVYEYIHRLAQAGLLTETGARDEWIRWKSLNFNFWSMESKSQLPPTHRRSRTRGQVLHHRSGPWRPWVGDLHVRFSLSKFVGCI